jgi:putative intracellular protease/amidase
MWILMVLTSHSKLGSTGKKTGFWLEEFTAPYYVFHDAGADITLASPKGGMPPLDPKSDEPDSQTASTERFKQDTEANRALQSTIELSEVNAEDYDAVFYPGGHGPLWDLSEDKQSIALIETMIRAGKPVALVCHAPGVLRHVKDADGTPLVTERQVTGFSNSEEEAAQLTTVVPFLVEDELKRLGAIYSKGPDWESYVEVDGNLITGQNPASSAAAAQEELRLVEANKKKTNQGGSDQVLDSEIAK